MKNEPSYVKGMENILPCVDTEGNGMFSPDSGSRSEETAQETDWIQSYLNC